MVVKTRPHDFRGENETIKKWYLFPDLRVVCPTIKKPPFAGGFFLYYLKLCAWQVVFNSL